jgi:hypothetical protein
MKRFFLMLPVFLSINGYSAQILAGTSSSKTLSSKTLVEPLYTKSAKTYSSFVFDAYAEYYQGRQFQELEDVNATELKIDLAFPIFNRAQLRFSLPFYTSGDGVKIENGEKTDLDGNGGTFNFASIGFEYQFLDSARSSMDLMGYVSIAQRTNRLKTDDGDYMNHRGKNAKAGARLDTDINPSLLFMTDVGYQYYWDTDDLNPSRNGDSFHHLVATAAIIKHDHNLKPALELTYRGDFSDYNNLAIVPELIYSFKAVDLKLGIPIGITNDADDYGVTLGFTYRMQK